jgi:type I restriction enzyme S subunit
MSSDWTELKLGEIVTFKTGKLDSNAAEETGQFPFFTCSPNTLAINSFAFDTEAVILAGNNANGVFSIKHYSGKFNAYQRTYVIEPINKETVSCRYAYFLLSQMIGSLKELSIGSATKFLTKTILNALPVRLPPKSEQDEIAYVLSALDDRITLLRETNTTLEAIAQALFKSWFVDFDPVHAKMQGRAPEGMDEATAALFSDSFEESELGAVPKGWHVMPVDDAVETVGGATPDTKTPEYWEPAQHHWTTPKDLSGIASPVLLGTERKLSDAGLKKISSGLLPVGSLLMSSRAPIGYLALTQVPMAINQGYIAIPPGGKLSPLFMLFWCQSNMDSIKGRANGSTFMEISKKAFRPIPVLVPSLAVIDAFEAVTAHLFARLVENEKQAQSLASIRDALLPRLISGQLISEHAIKEISNECT